MNYLSFEDPKCIEILNEGKPLVFPTETVYGIGVRYDLERGFSRLVDIKKRPPEKPFTLMISSYDEVSLFANVDENILRVVHRFFPGELTLILEAKETYPWVTLNHKTIGIRMSGSQKVTSLIHKVGVPLLVTSVNRSGKPPLNDVSDIEKEFEDEHLDIVRDNEILSGTPSTIVMIMNNEITCIRKGNIPFSDIENEWRNKK